MSEKMSKRKRKQVGYNPGDDPIYKRKYAILPCYKVLVPNRKRPVRARCGSMIATKGLRLRYRQLKKEK